MATQVPALIQLSDPRVAAQLVYLKETKEKFRGVFFQILCYQTEIEHINENKVGPRLHQ